MSKYSRRRRPRQIFLGNFYLNPSVQYLTTVISAIALAGFVFSGFLLFRFTDEEDLINRGKTQLMEGKVAWAAKTFQTLVTHHRDSYEGHLLLGQAYLQLDERRKAEQEFEIAASLKNKSKDTAPEVAMSKVAMAQSDFGRAEKILTQAWRKNRDDVALKQALFELYEHWGNTLYEADAKDYAQIIQKYQTALYYVNDYQAQQNIEERMVEAIQSYTERLIAIREYDTAIQQLKISLRYKYLPDTLVQIAEIYSRTNRLDDSITWFRKAFDVSPNVVGLRLTNALLEKGQQLSKAKQPEEAKKYLDEADKISQDAKISLDSLYPVSVSSVKIDNDMDEVTGEFEPTVSVQLSNDSTRDLNFLAVKAEFVSGNNTIAVVTQKLATPDKPFPSRLLKTWRPVNRVSLDLKPDNKLNVHALQDGKLTVKISIAYRDGNEAVWKLKSIQEASISTGTLRPVLEAKPV
ncbi:tetratricopeptide repeat protein [Vampirovibrio sp.]|uniref:tetratricopeptide repeat protein n=1 Tax=Vampirovibrio sp. TaxID=2717857 RepID=UPI0035930654